jgi:hypothetical protein
MTTLNPSHNPFHAQDSRHAQAVHEPSSSSGKHAPDSAASGFPDDLPVGQHSDSDESDSSDLGGDDNRAAVRRGRKAGRQRIQRGMMPVPDLRFEQVGFFPGLSPPCSRCPGTDQSSHTCCRSGRSSSQNQPAGPWPSGVEWTRKSRLAPWCPAPRRTRCSTGAAR